MGEDQKTNKKASQQPAVKSTCTQQPTTSSMEESKHASAATLHEDLEGRKQRVAELEAEYNSLKEVTDSIDRDVSHAAKEGN